jgi:hypothetical protein
MVKDISNSEITAEKMNFRIINLIPKISEKDREKIKTDIENKLFEVFKKYV